MSGLKRKKPKPSEAGFTLIEIMVVVIVLAIMASIVVPQFTGITKDAKVSAAKQNLKTLKGAINRFQITMDRYPTMEEGLSVLVTQPAEGAEGWSGPYVDELPVDPWNNNFVYRVPGENGKPFDLYSLGANGLEGGEGMDEDISVWRKVEEK